MPDRTADRHACRKPATDNTPTVTTSSRSEFTLITARAEQEMSTTASRQLRRASDFLAAARYMIRHHPNAGPATLRLAAVFAGRMHRSRHGHVAFNVAATVEELGVSRRTVLTHARYLRELGLIAWAEHGSKANILRARHGRAWAPGDGYRGTATIYAALAPPVWDHAQGHRIHGTGYKARLIGFTDKGRTRAVAAARTRQRRARRRVRPRVRTWPGKRCTPSVVVTSAPPRLQLVTRDKKNTRRGQNRKQPSTSIGGRPAPLTPADCRQAITLTEHLQREVWWLYDACSRRVAYALRPLIAAGWSSRQLAAELTTWGVPAHLNDPVAYLHHEITRRQHTTELPPTEPSTCPIPADDGTRYEAMLRNRTHHTPAWQRYTQHLRPALRDELTRTQAQLREHRRPTTHQYRPTLREPEEDFLASLPAETWTDAPTPRETYMARAQGMNSHHGQTIPPSDSQWLQHLNEHEQAARACDILRQTWRNLEEYPYDTRISQTKCHDQDIENGF